MTTELQSVRNLAATLRRQAEAQAERDAPLARCLTAWRASWDARAAPVVAEAERARLPAYVISCIDMNANVQTTTIGD